MSALYSLDYCAAEQEALIKNQSANVDVQISENVTFRYVNKQIVLYMGPVIPVHMMAHIQEPLGPNGP
jgi:hypothetical protein